MPGVDLLVIGNGFNIVQLNLAVRRLTIAHCDLISSSTEVSTVEPIINKCILSLSCNLLIFGFDLKTNDLRLGDG